MEVLRSHFGKSEKPMNNAGTSMTAVMALERNQARQASQKLFAGSLCAMIVAPIRAAIAG